MPSANPSDLWECWNPRCDRAQRDGVQLQLTAAEVVVDFVDAPHCPGCRLPVIAAPSRRWPSKRAVTVLSVLGGAALGGAMCGFTGVVFGATVGAAIVVLA
jgi:hypothetical protein